MTLNAHIIPLLEPDKTECCKMCHHAEDEPLEM